MALGLVAAYLGERRKRLGKAGRPEETYRAPAPRRATPGVRDFAPSEIEAEVQELRRMLQARRQARSFSHRFDQGTVDAIFEQAGT
jgi:hypothetical protein